MNSSFEDYCLSVKISSSSDVTHLHDGYYPDHPDYANQSLQYIVISVPNNEDQRDILASKGWNVIHFYKDGFQTLSRGFPRHSSSFIDFM